MASVGLWGATPILCMLYSLNSGSNVVLIQPTINVGSQTASIVCRLDNSDCIGSDLVLAVHVRNKRRSISGRCWVGLVQSWTDIQELSRPAEQWHRHLAAALRNSHMHPCKLNWAAKHSYSIHAVCDTLKACPQTHTTLNIGDLAWYINPEKADKRVEEITLTHISIMLRRHTWNSETLN